MTVYLHIGLHKTGTSSLQAFLRRNKPALLERGYLYPRTGWTGGGHHNLAYQLLGRKRFSEAAGGIDDLAAELDTAPNAILSSEEFEFLELAEVRRLKAALGDRDAKVLVFLRRQDALIASTYAQQVKMGAKMKLFDEYARISLYNPRFDFALLLSRWGAVFGEEALDVAVVSDETSGALLYDNFLARLGLGAARDLPRPPRRLNETPGAAEIEIVRRATDAVRRPGRPPQQTDMVELQTIAADLVAATPRLKDVGRLTLSEELYARVAERFDPGNVRAARYVASAQQRDALRFGAYAEGEGVAPPGRLLNRLAERAVEQWPFAAGVAG